MCLVVASEDFSPNKPNYLERYYLHHICPIAIAIQWEVWEIGCNDYLFQCDYDSGYKYFIHA